MSLSHSCLRWVLRCVLTTSRLTRDSDSPPSPSLHVRHIDAKKKGIAKKLILTIRAFMISQEVDLVADDFNGTAGRFRSRNNIITVDVAFTDCALPTPPGLTPLWDLDQFRTTGQTSVDFLNHRGSDRYWKVRMHGAFSIPRRTLGLRPTDQSCHHETWLHLDFVDWCNTWEPQGEHGRHISRKERRASYPHGQQKRRISEVMSDHSLSS